jgi:hypothetical protein
MKILVGAALYLCCSAIAILAHGLWAATPGTHASPFYWSMTGPTWEVCLSMVILYLGAFLSGIHPGRWRGTRLLPLIASGALVLFIAWIPWSWPCGLAATLLASLVLIWTVFFVAEARDY